MKTKHAGQTNLVKGGKEVLEKTNELKLKVEEMKREVTHKYALRLSNEKNLVKRILLVIKREVEIRRRIPELSSLKNLHTAHSWQM